jgi:hypothetical protein
MPSDAASSNLSEGNVGVAKNMPITAQNTANWVTRGLVSTQYCCTRDSGAAVWVGAEVLDMVV